MTVKLLSTIRVQKPWGRRSLWPGFTNPTGAERAIGEIWFDDVDGPPAPLLVKFLFTSEKLSIQVHPDDATAQAQGYVSGKEECWIVLEALPGATIGLGLTKEVSAEELRAAALDGSIEQLIDWQPVFPGDVIYVPAGTIHAIGGGITLAEIQQNVDLTYRLYDYGRPRDLHLDESLAVSKRAPFPKPAAPERVNAGVTVLVSGKKFVIEQWTGPLNAETPASLKDAWIVPLAGRSSVNRGLALAGQCLRISGACDVRMKEGASLLLAYPGKDVAGD